MKKIVLIFFLIIKSTLTFAEDYNFKKLVTLNSPWGSAFINDEELIITEKGGKIKIINIINNKIVEINHNLNFREHGQGGLLDIIYRKNILWISYTEKRGDWKTSTSIAKAKLNKDELKFENIFQAEPPIESRYHFGSRLAIKDNYLFASIGERGEGMIAQDPSKHPGSIIRINIDGSIPKDNPHHTNKPNWLPEIYQIGVRNPQGMAISPKNKKIYFSQHGPRGGDNIGILKKSGNYGWKVVAWGGTEYYGAKIGTEPFKKKYDLPIISWVPSIGVGQINFYSGNTFPEWDGNLIVSATKAGLLFRLVLENDKVVEQEIILNNEIGRIRDFEVGANGDIFLIVDDNDSSLWHLSR